MTSLFEEFAHKKILLIGADGKSGNSVLNFFIQSGLPLHLCDEKKMENMSQSTRSILDNQYNPSQLYFEEKLDNPSIALQSVHWDMIILSPGVPRSKKFIQASLDKGVTVISEIELAFYLDNESVIGITGTDGKSTTTSLTAFILNQLGYPASACGNIGLPYLEIARENYLKKQNSLTEKKVSLSMEASSGNGTKQVPVVELSSYQLESVLDFFPSAGALINLDEDHIDRYNSLASYLDAKLNLFSRNSGAVLFREKESIEYPAIFENLKKKNLLHRAYLFLDNENASEDSVMIVNEKRPADIGGYFFYSGNNLSLVFVNSEIRKRDEGVVFLNLLKYFSLSGRHNQENLAFAVILVFFYLVLNKNYLKADPKNSYCCNLKITEWGRLLAGFKGLDHRFEPIGDYNGVEVINDSKATTFQATQMAIFSRDKDAVVLIAGGRGKGGNLKDLADRISFHLKGLICIGETADEMEEVFLKANPKLRIKKCLTMEQAVQIGKDWSRAGDSLILSPGCASFDMYKNFELRGEDFREAVKKIFSRHQS